MNLVQTKIRNTSTAGLGQLYCSNRNKININAASLSKKFMFAVVCLLTCVEQRMLSIKSSPDCALRKNAQ